jgi:hypothetical protein
VTARNGAPETVNAIHRKENTEAETPNEIRPFGAKRVNLTTQNGERGAPHTSYTRQNNHTTTTNGDPVSSDEKGGSSSSSLVEDLRLTMGLSKSQCDTVVGYVLSHGQKYVQAKAQIVQSKSIRNRAGALLAALRDWQPSVTPAQPSGLPDSQERLASAEARGRARGWTW